MNITLVLYLLGYLIIIGYITWKSSQGESHGDYLNSSKNLTTTESTWTTFASLLTGYNFVIGVTFAYLYGIWYLFGFIGAAGAFTVLYLFYKKKLTPLQEKHNFLSIGDYYGFIYGSFTKNLVNSVLILALILFLVLQLFVNTNLFATLLDIHKIPALIITTGIVCVYLFFGGFKASVKTDIFQGILMLPIILIIFIFPNNFNPSNLSTIVDMSQLWLGVGLGFLQFFSLLGQAESFQRIFASRDSRSLKKAMIVSFSLLILIAGSIAYLGINFKLSGAITDPSNLFITNVLQVLPQWLKSLLTISLVAAFMGTIDSSAFALGTLLSKMKKPFQDPSILSVRLFILGSIIMTAISSLYLFSFLSSVFALISLISIIGASLLFSFIAQPKSFTMNLFIISGIILFILGTVFKFIDSNPITSLYPIIGAFIIGIFSMFMQKRK